MEPAFSYFTGVFFCGCFVNGASSQVPRSGADGEKANVKETAPPFVFRQIGPIGSAPLPFESHLILLLPLPSHNVLPKALVEVSILRVFRSFVVEMYIRVIDFLVLRSLLSLSSYPGTPSVRILLSASSAKA